VARALHSANDSLSRTIRADKRPLGCSEVVEVDDYSRVEIRWTDGALLDACRSCRVRWWPASVS